MQSTRESVATPVTPLTQEIRLATAVTGGVSLAIWMGGVTREINLLSQASTWRRAGMAPSRDSLSEESYAALGLYSKLIDLLDVTVDVDIMSGTSAGGINAALLGYSRAQRCDLGGLRGVWLTLGSMIDLLRDPTDATIPSLMYGDEKMLDGLNREIPNLSSQAGSSAPAPAKPPTTTLFVTTTLLTGESSRFTDSFGTIVQDVNQSGLFTFSEQHLVSSGIAAALALAARSSASFPAAFEPSFIPFHSSTTTATGVPARPDMAPYANITRPHWVADGGLLDNHPIDVMLETVFDRPARRAVRRILLYVVPSGGPAPNLAKKAPTDSLDRPYGLVDGLLKDLGAALSQSIAADLQQIRDHNDRADSRTDMRLQLAAIAGRLRPGTELFGPDMLVDYRARELELSARRLVGALLKLLSTWPPGPPAAGPTDEFIPASWTDQLGMGGNIEQLCRAAVRDRLQEQWITSLPTDATSLAAFGQAGYDGAKATAVGVVRAAFDLAKTPGQRTRLAGVTEAIHRAGGNPARPDLPALVRTVCTNPDVRTGTIFTACARLADDYLASTTVPGTAWTALGAALLPLRDADQLPSPAAVPERGDDEVVTAGSVRERDLAAARELRTYLGYLLQEDNPLAVARRLFELSAAQRAMLPIDADVDQPVELIQLSADTRNALDPSRATAADKLTGEQLHHFGAFYKRSWRANDWMWGRLDGAGWLVHLLLNPPRIQTIADDRAKPGSSKAAWFAEQLETIGAPALPLPAPPGAAPVLVDSAAIARELAYLDSPELPVPTSLPVTALWLAQAWQVQIAAEELQVVAHSVRDGRDDSTTARRPNAIGSASAAWADTLLKVPPATLPDRAAALLRSCPVPDETVGGEIGTPLMVRTLAKAAATATGAVGSVQQLPAVVRPAVTVMRTVTIGGYRVANGVKGVPARLILVGLGALILGVALAIQQSTVFGVTGLVLAGGGAYLIAFGAWQASSRLLAALLAITLLGAAFSLAIPAERRGLFGTSTTDTGVVGRRVHWLAISWWHPLVVLAVVLVCFALVAVVPTTIGRIISRRRARRSTITADTTVGPSGDDPQPQAAPG